MAIKHLFFQEWKPESLRCTRSVHILAVVFQNARVRSGLNARAMVRNTIVWVKKKVDQRHAEWIVLLCQSQMVFW